MRVVFFNDGSFFQAIQNQIDIAIERTRFLYIMYATQVAKSVAICVILSQILMVQAQTCQSPANAAAPPPGAEVINEFTGKFI
jgi:hypothetical protein